MTNSLWSLSEKIISVFGLIFITSLIARYIGVENFGKLNYAISIFSIVQTIAWVGAENIIFQRTSKNVKSAWILIKVTRKIRNIAFFSTALPLLLYFYYFTDITTFYFGIAASFSAYILSHDLYTIYFNAQLKSHINTICNLLGLLISLFVRYLIVIAELNYLWLCLPVILVALIPFLIRYYLFNYKEKNKFKGRVKIKNKYNNYLFKNGLNLLLYTLSVAIFTRTSQFFIGTFIGMREVGLYIVAATIGGGVSLVLNAFINSLMVNVYSEKSEIIAEKIVLKTYYFIILLCILFLIFLSLCGGKIIIFLYGHEYADSIKYLLWFCLAAMFSSLSNVSEKYIMRYYGYNYLLKKTIILLIFNLVLTYFLVKKIGLMGGVLSVVFTELVTATILNYFFRKGLIFKLHILAFKNIFSLSDRLEVK